MAPPDDGMNEQEKPQPTNNSTLDGGPILQLNRDRLIIEFHQESVLIVTMSVDGRNMNRRVKTHHSPPWQVFLVYDHTNFLFSTGVSCQCHNSHRATMVTTTFGYN